MEGYLGETRLNVCETPYADYNIQDWIMLWIEMYGGIEGSHHKAWLIDQIARLLKSTGIVVKLAKWENGQKEYRLSLSDPSEEYRNWVCEMKAGEDGPDTYAYDYGIAP